MREQTSVQESWFRASLGGYVNVSEGPFSKPNYWLSWYPGQLPRGLTGMVRTGSYSADRDFEGYCRIMERWRHRNGLIWGLAINMYGHAGAWSEALGMAGPLNEMLLQSWNRIIHMFPNWPKRISASFKDLRAQGAFLVSAAWENGKTVSAEIVSEKGLSCHLFSPWPNGFTVKDSKGKEVKIPAALEDVFEFTSPLGLLGKLADAVVLRVYVKRLLANRAQEIKKAAESDVWRAFVGP